MGIGGNGLFAGGAAERKAMHWIGGAQSARCRTVPKHARATHGARCTWPAGGTRMARVAHAAHVAGCVLQWVSRCESRFACDTLRRRRLEHGELQRCVSQRCVLQRCVLQRCVLQRCLLQRGVLHLATLRVATSVQRCMMDAGLRSGGPVAKGESRSSSGSRFTSKRTTLRRTAGYREQPTPSRVRIHGWSQPGVASSE